MYNYIYIQGAGHLIRDKNIWIHYIYILICNYEFVIMKIKQFIGKRLLRTETITCAKVHKNYNIYKLKKSSVKMIISKNFNIFKWQVLFSEK